ncbi:MAG: hypothetical protein M3151_09780 [Actinomycetota bacterium]|nr:hypothetical protein [Actinomycetota bacterium]
MSGDSVVVHGLGPPESCGLSFERGETYLIFANGAETGKDTPLQTNTCSATGQTGEDTVRSILGPPTGSLTETGGVSPERAEQEAGSTRAGAKAALALLMAGALLIFTVRVVGLSLERARL